MRPPDGVLVAKKNPAGRFEERGAGSRGLGKRVGTPPRRIAAYGEEVPTVLPLPDSGTWKEAPRSLPGYLGLPLVGAAEGGQIDTNITVGPAAASA